MMLTGDMLRRSASRFPGKPAIIWDDRRITYHELDAAADRFANPLVDDFPKTAIGNYWAQRDKKI